MNIDKFPDEVAKVFGVSREMAQQFLVHMDNKAEPNDAFFNEFFNNIPRAKYFEIPQKPYEPNNTNYFGKKKSENRIRENRNRYTRNLSNYNAKMAALAGRTTPLEDEIHINYGDYLLDDEGQIIGRVKKGDFGYVKPNKSQTNYVYKFMDLYFHNAPSLRTREAKNIFIEPLVNIFLQMDPVASPYVMHIKNVFSQVHARGYSLIFKLENLNYSVNDFIYIMDETKKPANKNLILDSLGPIYKTVLYLQDKYSFAHGDLHPNNIMLTKTSELFNEHGDLLERPKIHPKMIDFGLSGFKLGGKVYGNIHENYSKISFTFFFLARKGRLSEEDFVQEIEKHSGKSNDLMKAIVAEWEKNKTGGRRKQRKTRKVTKRHLSA
jgi:hypothetical protein